MHKVIGIDLGTTFSAVAAWDPEEDEAVVLSEDESGDLEKVATPSVVSVHPVLQKVIVGRYAKRNLATNPDNTIIEIKREMGAEFTPQTLSKYRASKVFKVDDPVKAHLLGNWRRPQEISSFILMKMKEIAEARIGQEIIDAVITVPAYFTEKQRSATQEAAILAGLYPRELIAEPNAAAVCYGVDQQDSKPHTYLIYDLGGGTFDVSIIRMQGMDGEVLATAGDPNLGGADFDAAVAAWTIKSLREKGNDYSGDLTAHAQIRLEAERAKVDLSSHEVAELRFPELNSAEPLSLAREQFVSLIRPLLQQSIHHVEKAINRCTASKGVTRDDIDAVLLVGGSSKIPAVKEMLLNCFARDEGFVRDDLNPDLLVARGAAIVAKRYAASEPPFNVETLPPETQLNPDDEGGTLKRIAEHSLGVMVDGGPRIARIVSQGSNIPISVSRDNYINGEAWTQCPVEVYQGEGETINECTKIGTVMIGPIEPRPKGEHQFEVTFVLDESGLLSVTVRHMNTNKPYSATFQQTTGAEGTKGLGQLGFLHKTLKNLYEPTPIGESEEEQQQVQPYAPSPPPGDVTPPESQ